MPQSPLEQVLGSVGRWRVTARTMDGVVVPFLSSDPVSAVVWTGDDQASLLAPTVAWVDAPNGLLSLTITAAMSAAVDPGTYRLQVFCTPPSDGERRILLDGSIRFLPTYGTAAPAKVYATYEDLLDYCPGIEQLQRDLSDQSGFAEQRARARTWFDEETIRNYHPVPGRTRRMADLAGTATGPYMTFADPPTGAAVPSDVELQAMLDADGLEVTDVIRECVSHKAAAVAYKSSPAYANEGARHEAEANRLWYRATVEVKSDPDLDAPDLRIGRDVTFLT